MPRALFLSIACLLAAAAASAAGGRPTAPGAQPVAVGPRTEPVEQGAYAAVRYVSASGGSDTRGDGSRARPWATVRHALSAAAPAAGRRWAVLAAEGSYPEAGLRLKAAVDLYGGFSRTSWQRDVARFRSVLDARQ